MFRANNAAVSWYELEQLTNTVVQELEGRDPDAFSLLLAVDGGRTGPVVLAPGGDDTNTAVQAATDQLFASARRMAAMASVTGWSPSPEEPVVASWVVIAVASGLPALAVVRRAVEDHDWSAIHPSELPYFAASTAASLRAAIETGKRLTLKQTADPRLYRRPDEEPDPPLDDQGRL